MSDETTPDLTALRELLAAATHIGGAWSNGDPEAPVHAVFSGAVCVAGLTRTRADAALIAAAVNALPALLDAHARAESAEAALAGLREGIEALAERSVTLSHGWAGFRSEFVSLDVIRALLPAPYRADSLAPDTAGEVTP